MNILLIILCVIAAFVLFFLTLALFLKKEYIIEKEILIKKPASQVFDFIKLIRNQQKYNKWTMMDPDSKLEYRGTDGTVGFFNSWDSSNKQVGKGEQEITRVDEGSRVDISLHFLKPMEGRSTTYITTESTPSGETKVSWVFNGKMKYPMNAMVLFFNLPEMLGKDLEESLGNLKNLMEK